MCGVFIVSVGFTYGYSYLTASQLCTFAKPFLYLNRFKKGEVEEIF